MRMNHTSCSMGQNPIRQSFRYGLSALLMSIALVGGVATPPAHAETWVEYNTNQDFRFFVDRDSIRKDGQIVWTSAYVLFDRPLRRSTRSIGSFQYYLSLDCRARSLRVRQLVAYDPNKTYIDHRELGDRGPLFRAPNDIVTQQLFSNLCRR
jgi:hypothetical protein